MNKRIRKKHAKQNWLRLQQEMADPATFHRKYGGVPVDGWQKQAIWMMNDPLEVKRESD